MATKVQWHAEANLVAASNFALSLKRQFRSQSCASKSFILRRTTGVVAAAAGESQFFLPRPRKRADWVIGPSFELTREEAVEMQLKALSMNEEPYRDHGIEVLYRFANFDPFERSDYFGRSLDLGQFERFRRVFHTPFYRALLSHQESRTLSNFEVSELKWKQRVWVRSFTGEEGVFEFTMDRHLGGRYDGFWFTHSLLCDGVDNKALIV